MLAVQVVLCVEVVGKELGPLPVVEVAAPAVHVEGYSEVLGELGWAQCSGVHVDALLSVDNPLPFVVGDGPRVPYVCVRFHGYYLYLYYKAGYQLIGCYYHQPVL